MGLWPLDHDVVLFAWLDFCNEHKIDYLATIERELEEKTEISRSRAAVCSHLRYIEWRCRKPNEKRRIQHDELVPHIGIIENGSQGLRYPPKEMTLKIRKALREYEKEYSSDKIQKLVKITSKKDKPSQLKVQPLPRSSPPVKKPEYSSSNVRKRVSPPEDGEHSNKKRCVEQNTKSIPPQKRRRKLELQRPQLTSTLKSATIQPLNDRLPTEIKLSNVQPEISHLSKTPSVDGEGDDKVTKPTQKHIDEVISESQESYKKRLKEKEAQIITIREYWDCDLRELHERIEKLQQANLELEAKNSSLESAVIDASNAGRNPLADMIGQKNREIWKLTDMIHRQFEVSSIKEAQVKYLPYQQVDNAMNEIRLELETMTQNQDSSSRLSSREWFGGDLDHLVNSAFASPEGSIDGRIRLKKLALRIGSFAVLSLLTITALRDWVFLTDFPRVELGSLSLIEAYRSIAFNQGGWDELRCYDFGAFKEHMKKSYFKEELIRTARQLSCRLSRTLSLMFGKSLEDVVENFSFHTWGEKLESWKERQYHFEKLFRIALELKSDSIITDDTYTFEFLLNETHANKPIDGPEAPEGFWLRFSIGAYKSKSLVTQDERVGALVQTRNFLSSVTDDWICDYQKNLYLSIDREHNPENMLSHSRDLSRLAGRSRTDSQNVEQEAFQPEEPGTLEVAYNNNITIDKISEPLRNIPQLPLQLSGISSEHMCKICKSNFKKNQGLRAHQRNRTCRRCKACRKVWPTIAALKDHTSKNHNEEIENLASSTSDHMKPQPAAIPISQRETKSDVAIEEGICEKDDIEGNDVEENDVEENDLEENDAAEDDVEKNDLDLYSAKALESVSNGEADHSHVTKSRTYSISEIPNSTDFEQEDGEERGSTGSVPCLLSTIETDDINLLPKGNRTSGEEMDSASEETEGEGLINSESKHAWEKIQHGEGDMVGSEDSRHRSNSQTIIELDVLIKINSDTFEIKEDAGLDICGQKIEAESESSSTTGSSTRDLNLETLETQSPDHWIIAEGYDTSNILFESPKLTPERRASQLFLVTTEDEEAADEDADGYRSPEVNTPGNVIAEEPKSMNAAEGEDTDSGKHDGGEINLYDGIIGVDHDDDDQTEENENYESHDVYDEGVKLDNNDGRKATDDGFIGDKTDEDEIINGTGTAEAMRGIIKNIIREMCEEYTAWITVTTNEIMEVASNESIADIFKKLCEDFTCVVVKVYQTPEAESEKAIDVDDIAYHEAQEPEGVDVTTKQHIEDYVNNTDMVKDESKIEVENKDSLLEHKVEEDRVIEEDADVHDDMTAETKIEKSIEFSTNERNDTESNQPLARANRSADNSIDRNSPVNKVQEQGSSLGGESDYGRLSVWLYDRLRRPQQQGKSNGLDVQSEVQSEEKKDLELEGDDVDEVQVVPTEFACD
ncbi:hypothetical protein BHYA_0166g00050 [Botrytis hyacinthi]|uniref:C2H2-type domain-containing protein n=1 Tax=Botrytis hyacinthi TaxID=278943 RepID=A0A4Z1GIA4_9HELO|nr:hypothetical protein BHYA_0166g00050 [Botrytis hyacinthi]